MQKRMWEKMRDKTTNLEQLEQCKVNKGPIRRF